MHISPLAIVLCVLPFIGVASEPLARSRRAAGCFCAPSECCSKWGYCGVGEDYCGKNCQSGACYQSTPRKSSPALITSELFTCVFPKLDGALRAQRWQGLVGAMNEMHWQPVNAVEAAVFLSHVSHETDGLQTLVEYCAASGTCNNYQSSWCSVEAHPKVKYYGRGLFQLSYPCNYHNAGKALGLDLLKNPDLVGKDEKIAASTAIWYYKETGMSEFARKGDFASTTRKLNEYECTGKAGYHMQQGRLATYQRVRRCFDLPEATTNLLC